MSKKFIISLLACALLLLASCASNEPPVLDEPTPDTVIAEPVATPEPTPDGSQSEALTTPEPEPALPEISAYEKYMQYSDVLSVQAGSDESFDIDFVMDMKMEMTMQGQKGVIEMPVAGNIKMISEDGVIKLSSVMDMGDILGTGTSSIVEMYYDGERGYYALDGEKIDVPDDYIIEQMTGNTDVPEFPESAVITFDTSIDGDTEETFAIIDGSALTDYILEAAGSAVAELGEGAEVSVDDVMLTMVNKTDGTPVSLDMRTVMYMSNEEMWMKMSISMNYVINAYGSGVEIDFSRMK